MGRGRRESAWGPGERQDGFGASDDGFGPALGREDPPSGRAARRGPAAGDGEDFGPALEGARETRSRRRDRRRGRRGERDDFGPPVQGRNRLSTNLPRPPRVSMRRTGRALRVILTVLLVLVLVVAGGAAALAALATVTMNRVEVAGLAPRQGGVMNVLIVGSDSREGLTPEQLEALGTEAVAGQRTDSIFVLSVRGGAAAILSFPRDLYVTRCDGSSGRINGAFSSSGGATCLVNTVSQTAGLPITHYMEVDFAGFLSLVDTVGGVTVFLEQPMVDRDAGVNLPQGCVTLDGRQALGFVRARKIDSDLGRIARQQRFIGQLANEVATPSMLLNPARLYRVTQGGARALTADTGLGVIDLLRLARAGRGLAAGGLATYTVPAESDTIDGQAVLVPGADAEALFARFRDGSVLDVPTGDLQPADITVDVLNGAGIQGLAARGREELVERGFVVGEVGNAEGVPRTVIRHAPGLEAAAGLVAQQFPGVPVEATPPGSASDLALVVGPDGPALFDAAPAGAPAPAPAPTPGQPAPAPSAPAVPLGAGPVPATC